GFDGPPRGSPPTTPRPSASPARQPAGPHGRNSHATTATPPSGYETAENPARQLAHTRTQPPVSASSTPSVTPPAAAASAPSRRRYSSISPVRTHQAHGASTPSPLDKEDLCPTTPSN